MIVAFAGRRSASICVDPKPLTAAIRDRDVKVILLQGAGRSFCGGFNFGEGFRYWDDDIATDDQWDAGRDLIMVTSQAIGWVPRFMSLWRSPKPVIAQVHGWCVGGGSEMALCADIVIASEDARIGTPYSRMWGCHHAGMWVYRLGLARAKELALTGRAISGSEASDIGLINAAVPFEELEKEIWVLNNSHKGETAAVVTATVAGGGPGSAQTSATIGISVTCGLAVLGFTQLMFGLYRRADRTRR